VRNNLKRAGLGLSLCELRSIQVSGTIGYVNDVAHFLAQHPYAMEGFFGQ
jgi:hypothetical protein